jgi:squalene synthase HpnC
MTFGLVIIMASSLFANDFRVINFFIKKMTVEHYENFPVASILLPAHLRPAVHAVYHFARTADDIADEGDATSEQRLTALEEYDQELGKIENHVDSQIELFQNLNAVIQKHQLPINAFRDLLSAFKQDVVTARYRDFAELLDYCRRSANPVGAIMLQLYQEASPQNLKDSDAICSALQLINFWQDVAIDWTKQRIYLPQEDLMRFNINEKQIEQAQVDKNWQDMMCFQTQRARTLILNGSPLCKRLPGRIGWELRLVVQGGLRILERIDNIQGDVFQKRPKLNKIDWPYILWRALWM